MRVREPATGGFRQSHPQLTFEVIADDRAIDLADIVDPLGADAAAGGILSSLAGFAVEGGPMSATLATVDRLFPLACDAGGDRLTIAAVPDRREAAPTLLPPAVRGWGEGDFGLADGERRNRISSAIQRPDAVRYYDIARDYQPGVQRPAGRARSGPRHTLEFPGALAANDARSLTEAVVRRSGWSRDRIQWRLADLDPALAPGSEVRVPGHSGIWRVEGWEWLSRGVELDLVRFDPLSLVPATGDSGSAPMPVDARMGPTSLIAFETPATGFDAAERTLFAAATSSEPGWNGATLYVERAGELMPIGSAGRSRAILGVLSAPLAASPGLHFEPNAGIEVALVDHVGTFAPTTLAGLAQGANRLLVADEVIQFLDATQTGQGAWRLSGLLRGRGGTEPAALAGHSAGTCATLLDDALVALDPAKVPSDPSTIIAAIGLGDVEPVRAALANPGRSRQPLCPVHPRVLGSVAAGLELHWTRRARGAWLWPDGVDVPLVEQDEQYCVGLGPVGAPIAEWPVNTPSFSIASDTLGPLAAANPGAALWVRQVGSYSQSEPLFLTYLP